MQLEISYPPDTKAWYWGMDIINKDPIEVEIESVCIWLEGGNTTITYSFKEKGTGLSFGRHDKVFPTYEESNDYKRECMKIMRDGLNRQ